MDNAAVFPAIHCAPAGRLKLKGWTGGNSDVVLQPRVTNYPRLFISINVFWAIEPLAKCLRAYHNDHRNSHFPMVRFFVSPWKSFCDTCRVDVAVLRINTHWLVGTWKTTCMTMCSLIGRIITTRREVSHHMNRIHAHSPGARNIPPSWLTLLRYPVTAQSRDKTQSLPVMRPHISRS